MFLHVFDETAVGISVKHIWTITI